MMFVPYSFLVSNASLWSYWAINKRNDVVSVISIYYPAPRKPNQPNKADTSNARGKAPSCYFSLVIQHYARGIYR